LLDARFWLLIIFLSIAFGVYQYQQPDFIFPPQTTVLQYESLRNEIIWGHTIASI